MNNRAHLPRLESLKTMKTISFLMSVVLLTGCAAGAGFKPASATIKPAGAPAAPVTLTHFKLTGNLTGGLADFTLTATAHVEDAKGGTLDLLSGPVAALTAIDTNRNEHVWADRGHFYLEFDRKGVFPLRVRFSAAVRQADDWNGVDFQVAPSAWQPVACKDWRRKRSSSFPVERGRNGRGTNLSVICRPAAR